MMVPANPISYLIVTHASFAFASIKTWNCDWRITIVSIRTQRRYDHRLPAMVQNAVSVELARQHGLPKSTARGWLS